MPTRSLFFMGYVYYLPMFTNCGVRALQSVSSVGVLLFMVLVYSTTPLTVAAAMLQIEPPLQSFNLAKLVAFQPPSTEPLSAGTVTCFESSVFSHAVLSEFTFAPDGQVTVTLASPPEYVNDVVEPVLSLAFVAPGAMYPIETQFPTVLFSLAYASCSFT